MYKKHFDKPNIELWKTHLAAKSRNSKLLIQISNIHMCVVPGPASQDAVIKRVYASPGLQCSYKNGQTRSEVFNKILYVYIGETRRSYSCYATWV
jgi:hypothetical protein